MNVTITPTKLCGTITPPPSKSQAHRLLIAAALAEGTSVISNVAFSQDIEATLSCMEALGARARVDGSTVTITGIGDRRRTCGSCMADAVHLDCGESGSTLRFLIPVALVAAGGAFFTGRGRLLQRPQEPYADLFAEKGVFFHRGGEAISVRGDLTPGVYRLPGNVSSQFFTGLLYALALLDGDSVVESTTALESRDYIRMTIQALAQFGVDIREDGDRFLVPGGQKLTACDCAVEADWSQAGFWYAAGAVGNDVKVDGMCCDSAQGDRCDVAYTEALCGQGTVTLDVSGCPDLVPPLAAHAALRAGQTTHLVNAARLRMKESDRLASVTQVLNALGASVEEHPDSLTIHGVETLHGGTVDSHNDHRIAMMAAIAATAATGPVTITDAGSVAKSYPNFWEDYEALGGQISRSQEENP
jgi:3-phosphoshikimate 1-carboxyvinyltransferase